MKAPTPPIAEAIQQEADHLVALARALQDAADATKQDAKNLRAHARGLKPGEIGLLPGWGYTYARMRLATLARLGTDWPTEGGDR